jgi:hypothetical protein
MIGEQHGAQLGEFLAADPRARELASLRKREPLNHNRRCLSLVCASEVGGRNRDQGRGSHEPLAVSQKTEQDL